MTRDCNQCGRPYKVKGGRENVSKYCSAVCKQAAGNRRIKKACAHCRAVFAVKPSRSLKGMCSKECDSAWRRARAENKTEKQCTRCELTKPVSEFAPTHSKKNNRLYFRSKCIPCEAEIRNSPDARARAHARYLRRRDAPEQYAKMKACTREGHERARRRVLEAYGGRCACCGEDTAEFLAVDHIENDGADERRKGYRGQTLYRALIRLGFPKDRYQLLCHNCNMAKAFYGVCPHASRRAVAA